MPEIFIVDAVRTPIGKLGGVLAHVRPVPPTKRVRTTATSPGSPPCSPACPSKWVVSR
jgi:hypothetical protein